MAQSSEIARSRPSAAALTAWTGYPWVVLAASLLVQTTASFGSQAVSPLAPFLVADLGLTRQQIGFIVTASVVGASVVLILAGSLSDRFGVRRLFLFGMTLTGLPLALAAWMPDYGWLL
nr:MFS transporter [Chloroflexota bacterium]